MARKPKKQDETPIKALKGFDADLKCRGFQKAYEIEGEVECCNSGDNAKIGSSGYGARIGSSGYGARIVAEGKHAVIACADKATVAAAEGGAICIPYHDGERTRFAIGYVGEDGIEAGVAYVARDGKLVPAEGR